MSWYLDKPIDFERHNADVRAVWAAFQAGRPTRVPVSVHGSIRNFIQNPVLNTTGWTFEDFFSSPQAQIDCQLGYQKWCRYNLVCDREMGPPGGGWQVGIDFQNSYDAGWFGCPLHVDGNAVPDTVEILKEDKHRLYEMSCPDPLRGNLLGRAMEFFEYMHDRCPHVEFEGLPVFPPRTIPGEGNDGVLDAAYKLRGAAEVCTDMMVDPTYFHDLMGFICDCLIRRMKAISRWRWERFPDSADRGNFKRPYSFADDAIVLLSLEQYAEHVFPYHQRLAEEFSDGGPVSIHMCGDHARFFPFLRDHLRVRSVDTGFPIDPGALRRALGPDVRINAGPTVMLVKQGPARAIRDDVRRICGSGIMDGGKFVMIAANNMAPLTPLEHVDALYEAAKEFGQFRT
ncbi:MAG: hypothetical protein HN742_17610 [Lentisphaerae bacterium]|jgi:hypothetical protein|nr:hypothetical protein [Lentisphaerota bacterium]MBT5611932.1 hypothetical protein [Lentisphaerota bacterium]MBT7057914.1 hypothetical protein [Lentisphaerota bacterium]MBT7843699.1 hypothetical protein [Lentisphaerota bacterium]